MRLPAPSRQVLIESSVAEVVSGPLADAITSASDGHRVLTGLAARNSFVTAVSPDGAWFRCHPLLREVLRSLLSAQPDAAAAAHRRAAAWFADEGLTARAVHHAVQAADWALAADLLLNGGWEASIVRGLGEPAELAPILTADLASIPADQHARVLTAQALVAAATGQWNSARATLDRLAGMPTDGSTARLIACALLLVSHLDGELSSVEEHAAAVSRDRNDLIAIWAILIRGEARYWSQQYPEAGSDLERVSTRAAELGLPALAVRALGMLTLTATATGRLDPAHEYAERGADIARSRLAPDAGILDHTRRRRSGRRISDRCSRPR